MTRSLAWAITVIILLGAAVLAGKASQAPTAPRLLARAPASELARCQALGEEAGRDEACRKAWAAARERFFGRAAS